jgi:precorrin-8X/cobalt-precorrin-8 methylmutase
MNANETSPAAPHGDVGILVVGHGSPRAQANEGFVDLVERVAARLGTPVLATFFSLAKPDIDERVADLAGQGCRRIVLMPYFLYTGQHVAKDIPALLARCRERFPDVQIDVLPTLEGEPALVDVVVERLTPYAPPAALPTDGPAIERRSHQIIDRQLVGQTTRHNPVEQAVIRRVVHATADLSFARSLRLHRHAVEAGRSALRQAKPILCDVRMLQAGITRVASEVLCAIGEPATAERARKHGGTRAAAAMETLRDRIDGAIVAIGNAPTALWKIMEIAASGGPRPALVVGLPVGFVGARESKLALIESGLCHIANTTARGGSAAAAAAVNALALSLKEDEDA